MMGFSIVLLWITFTLLSVRCVRILYKKKVFEKMRDIM